MEIEKFSIYKKNDNKFDEYRELFFSDTTESENEIINAIERKINDTNEEKEEHFCKFSNEYSFIGKSRCDISIIYDYYRMIYSWLPNKQITNYKILHLDQKITQKCHFMQEEVLGYKLSTKDLSPLNSKKPPKEVHKLRLFLGAIGHYCNFIDHCEKKHRNWDEILPSALWALKLQKIRSPNIQALN
ncbi:hypothetical protein H8356DRAFT_1346758 [Neocallimastix lanati (nom. inval.)]|nr:hypothetical protein H8356DRAFT_1346758 [Neocallimastix sp. JGI-2020a]